MDMEQSQDRSSDAQQSDPAADNDQLQRKQQAREAPGKVQNETPDNDDDEECGFCRFMKGGGCKDQFIAWQKCVDDSKARGEKYEEVCQDYTTIMFNCMQDHSEYYFASEAPTNELGEDDEGGQQTHPEEEQQYEQQEPQQTNEQQEEQIPQGAIPQAAS